MNQMQAWMTRKNKDHTRLIAHLGKTFKSRLLSVHAPRRFPIDLTLGILVGLTEAFFAISLVNLIFTGPLSIHLSLGISLALLASTIVILATSLLSTIPFGIGLLQDSPVIIMAVLIGGYLSSPVALDPETLFATVLTSMIVGTLLVGLTFIAVGILRMGEFVRYIPYPVIGGFLAGTGWLITLGGMSVVLDRLPASLPELQLLMQPEQLIVWLPAVLSGVTIFAFTRAKPAPMTLPSTIVSLLLIFYLFLFIVGIPINEAMSRGLLLGDLGASGFQFISLNMLNSADWKSILGQAGNFGVLVGISLTSFLLYMTSLEVTAKKDVDINRELQTTGLINVVTGMLSGMIGYLSLSLSALTYRSGTRSRVVGLTAGVVVAGILALGFSFLRYFPLSLVAGVLLYIGFDFLFEWLVSAWKRFSRIEYAVIVLILVVIALTDFLVGVLVGLAVMIVMFVVSYSQVRTVQQVLTGGDLQSNVDRNALERRWFAERGHAVRILVLRGFLFFGTANSIVQNLREILAEPTTQMPSYILLDFKNVTGMDASAALSFIRIEHLGAEHGIGIVLTGLSKNDLTRLVRGGMTIESDLIHRFPDLDRGLEWCEQQLLENAQHPCDPLPEDISSQLVALGFDKRSINRLLDYLEPIDLIEGEYLILKDDDPDALYYIERGRVSVVLDQLDGEQIRLRSLTHGATVGEMGLYSGNPRSASVIADEPTRVHCLSLQAMETMTDKEPELLAAFHRWVAASLSERLAQKSRSIGALHSG